MTEQGNDDLKAQMKAALERKQGVVDGVPGAHHHKEKGPAERGRQGGGGGLFRRKAGGGG